jgi:hypothetical protein
VIPIRPLPRSNVELSQSPRIGFDRPPHHWR